MHAVNAMRCGLQVAYAYAYEGFVDDVRVGDYLMVDGGMTIIKVSSLLCMCAMHSITNLRSPRSHRLVQI